MALFASRGDGAAGTRRRLSATSAKLRRAREELALVDEQVAALRHDADDARTDALVRGGTAKREATQAIRSAEKLAEASTRLRRQIAELEREQDALLDRLPSTS